ncbi:transposase [Candidatus Moduliflexus flocculans]|uniref:Transposase n=1 Tax=Candidatus Moduliflexus flocculans TaxID=1499966 RepID=A0A0S6VQB4_9BACT|nr:transposase [Candidatus Moduliflexus flocculans]
MTELAPLITMLPQELDWHRARITFLAQFLVAVIRVRTVNLTEIATAFCGRSKTESSYRRIQRFFQAFEIAPSLIPTLVVRLLPLDATWTLCLDRTNWQLGAINLNFLVLAVAHHGIAIPLFWSLLDKRGHSNTKERIRLMRRFLRQFGAQRIHCLTADREFIGVLWLRFLRKHQIPFRLRIRHNTQLPLRCGAGHENASRFFRNAPLGVVRLLRSPRPLWGLPVYVVGLRLAQEYLILITDARPDPALDDYRRRWDIETLFGCLKTHGFHLEDTHLTAHQRLSKLLALLTITCCWCVRLGAWRHAQRAIPLKSHQRRAVSLFRYGLDVLRNIVLNLAVKPHEFAWVVKLLSCT